MKYRDREGRIVTLTGETTQAHGITVYVAKDGQGREVALTEHHLAAMEALDAAPTASDEPSQHNEHNEPTDPSDPSEPSSLETVDVHWWPFGPKRQPTALERDLGLVVGVLCALALWLIRYLPSLL